MNNCILLLLVLLSSTLKPQSIKNYPTDRSDDFAETFKSYFDNLKKEDYKLLVPYYEKGKWGYLYKDSLKRVTPAFASQLNLYKGDGYLGSVRDSITDQEYIFYLNREGKMTFQVSVVSSVAEARPPAHYSRALPHKVEKKSSKKGYKGFDYGETAGYIDIIAYSDVYASYDPKNPLLIPIKMDDKVYAIAGKKTKDPYLTHYGIIDQRGRALKGFDFVHQKIRPVTGMKDRGNTWYIVQTVEDTLERYSYVNHKGKYLMKNELTRDVLNSYESSPKQLPYYEPKNTVLDYVLSENIVFDLYEMNKIEIVPAGYKAMSIGYATEGFSKEDALALKRSKSLFYIWVGNEEESFYMDFDGKEYRPLP